MPSAFVTGASGFVGLHLVRSLVASGWHVTANHPPSRDPASLSELGATPACADITDRDSVLAAMPNAPDVVFHLAASVGFAMGPRPEQTLVNRDGTRNVVRAALARKSGRFVHTSSLSAFGPANASVLYEDSELFGRNHWVSYYHTKWLAEQEVQFGMREGLDAVILNPGNILGPGDRDHWGHTFIRAKERKVAAIPPGGAPFCHVSDVVAAHVAAAHRGRAGSRYLLGGVHASYREFFELMHARLGLKAPPVAPAWAVKTYARALELLAAWKHVEPSLSSELAFVLCTDFEVGSDKAQVELGVTSRSLSEMVSDTYEWLKAQGLV